MSAKILTSKKSRHMQTKVMVLLLQMTTELQKLESTESMVSENLFITGTFMLDIEQKVTNNSDVHKGTKLYSTT